MLKPITKDVAGFKKPSGCDYGNLNTYPYAWKARRKLLNEANHIMFLAGGTEEDVIRIAEYQGLNADLMQNSNEELQDLLEIVKDEYGQ